MGTLLPFKRSEQCDNSIQSGQETGILSDKHKQVLDTRLDNLIKMLTKIDIRTVQGETPKKLGEVHCSQDFAVKMTQRVNILYQMLFDSSFPKSKKTEKTIAAGLLYFISPGDLLPDEVPGLGYLDDAYVIARVMEKECGAVKSYLKSINSEEQAYL